MIIKIGFDIEFNLVGPTPMIVMLYVHPSRRQDLRTEERLLVRPNVPVTQYTDFYGNICGRLLAPAGDIRLTLDALIEDHGRPDREQCPDAVQHKVEDLPNEALAYLLPSRYCEVDKLSDVCLETIRANSARLAARAGHLRLGKQTHHFRLPTRESNEVGL